MQKVQALVAGVDDPRVRLDVMSTINFLADLFHSGRINENQLRNDLFEIASTVISMTRPELTEDDVRRRANVVVEELTQTLKVDQLYRRTLSRFMGMLRAAGPP
jgi:hypothetical protein